MATNDPTIKKIIESFRDWGRDCWCPPGHDNTCKKRFNWKLGDLPEGYDHKYIYSHAGYNLKITDMQASIALSQMDKLEEFINIRQRNFDILNQGLKDLEEIFILPHPTPNSIPSWFGFPITIKEETNVNREGLLQYLNKKKIGTRLLFGGNLTKQPYFRDVSYRIYSDVMDENGQPILPNTDMIMNNTFWLGVYPALTSDHIHYVIESITQYVRT